MNKGRAVTTVIFVDAINIQVMLTIFPTTLLLKESSTLSQVTWRSHLEPLGAFESSRKRLCENHFTASGGPKYLYPATKVTLNCSYPVTLRSVTAGSPSSAKYAQLWMSWIFILGLLTMLEHSNPPRFGHHDMCRIFRGCVRVTIGFSKLRESHITLWRELVKVRCNLMNTYVHLPI